MPFERLLQGHFVKIAAKMLFDHQEEGFRSRRKSFLSVNQDVDGPHPDVPAL
jgi:hypothetical protein